MRVKKPNPKRRCVNVELTLKQVDVILSCFDSVQDLFSHYENKNISYNAKEFLGDIECIETKLKNLKEKRLTEIKELTK